MRRRATLAITLSSLVLLAVPVHADVAILAAGGFRGADRAKRLAAKDAAKKSRPRGRSAPLSAGALELVDQSGLKFFIDTGMTFATSSSASGAAMDATFTQAVGASTSAGGTVTAVLKDAFDGYASLCTSVNGTLGPCTVGNPDQVLYNQLGAGALSCSGRQYDFPVQTLGSLTVQRKVYVPANDSFIRWMNVFTNTGGAPLSVSPTIFGNLGSDESTVIVATSSGDAVATVADTWVTTFQNWSGTTSSDPRLAHVLWGGAPKLAPAAVHIVAGEGHPWWSFTFPLAPGETGIILSFASGHGTKAAAAGQAARLVTVPMPTTALACTTALEQTRILNFDAVTVPVELFRFAAD